MQVIELKITDIKQLDKSILIYGAGKYASIFLTYLQTQGINSSVKGCIVSQIDDNKVFLSDLSVKSVDEIEDLKSYTIVIAIAKENAEAIYHKLEEQGVDIGYQVTSEMIADMASEIATFFSLYPIDENKVFIDCFEGLGYRCNCKYLAEALKKYDYEIVWNLSDRAVDDIPEWITKVKRYSFEYFREAYTAKFYITNNGVEAKIYKRKNQVFICPWHGSGPFKKINIDLCQENIKLKKSIQEEYRNIDLFISSSKFNSQVIRRAFGYEGEILECGSPRMDCLLQKNNFRDKICKYYHIDRNCKIVLYAPTFRKACIGDEGPLITSFEKYDLQWEMIQKALEKRYKEPFVFLYRFHHGLYRYTQSNVSYQGAVNVTFYPDVQELLGAADILLTDYSSIMWDFSLQRKPVFLYHNDVDEYIEKRGFYSQIDEWPYIKAKTSEGLCEKILHFDNEKYLWELDAFLKKYGTFDDGHACKKVMERILQYKSKLKEEIR